MTFRADPTLFVLALSLSLTLGATGCEKPAERQPSPRSTLKVSLPDRPSLSARELRIHHADGAFTIPGVLASAGKLVGKNAKVRGRVAEIFTCPKPPPPPPEPPVDPAAAKKKKGKKGKEAAVRPPPPPRAPHCPKGPHMFLAEEVAGDGDRLLVVGSERTAIGTAKVGDEVTVEGTFEIMTRDGRFIRQAGLVVLPEPPPPEPPPVPVPADTEAPKKKKK